MTKDEALLIALEALEVANSLVDAYYLPKEKAWLPEIEEAITAIKAVQEAKDMPVAEVTSETGADITMSWWHEPALPVGTKLYITPPQRKPLTDEEIKALDYSGTRIEFVRAIEAKLKEKNT